MRCDNNKQKTIFDYSSCASVIQTLEWLEELNLQLRSIPFVTYHHSSHSPFANCTSWRNCVCIKQSTSSVIRRLSLNKPSHDLLSNKRKSIAFSTIILTKQHRQDRRRNRDIFFVVNFVNFRPNSATIQRVRMKSLRNWEKGGKKTGREREIKKKGELVIVSWKNIIIPSSDVIKLRRVKIDFSVFLPLSRMNEYLAQILRLRLIII